VGRRYPLPAGHGRGGLKRRLYTDDEDVIIELRRAVLLNGINVPTDRGDVLDRSLVVELERIPDAERKTEEELWERFGREHPRLLGALLDVLSKAIALKPTLQLSRGRGWRIGGSTPPASTRSWAGARRRS
jgi:hypothetical protein